ncbi:MAG: fumarate hydratase [Eubacteriales bacterium]|nr:fumarate hydratase [Eubacteriales bacterium]MDD7506801.1 fumarate hydratase [Clostridiales bacterium]MDY5726110.1 fumarate hydratase [Eubacteriales bacterium]
MRTINLADVTAKIKEMFIDACENIPQNVLDTIKDAEKQEESPLGKEVLGKIIENDLLAREKHLPICQDTGVAVVYLTIGSEVTFTGDIYEAVNEGVRQAYTEGYLRKSVVRHPLDRVNTKDNTPAIVHVKVVPGDTFRIDVAPKGGGSENMSVVKMLIPADGVEGIKKLVIDTVFNAGGKPCPPVIVGIGIGGNFEKCALMAKEALFREIDDRSPDPLACKLEEELKEEINKLGVGPMGFGGRITCLAVKVNVYPCHIASLPVAINIQCHAARHKSCTL